MTIGFSGIIALWPIETCGYVSVDISGYKYGITAKLLLRATNAAHSIPFLHYIS